MGSLRIKIFLFVSLLMAGSAHAGDPPITAGIPWGEHEKIIRPRQPVGESARPEDTSKPSQRFQWIVDHYDPEHRSGMTAEKLTALVTQAAKAYAKIPEAQRDPKVRGESSTPAEGFDDFARAGGDLLSAFSQLGVNGPGRGVNFQDPAQMQQALALFCLEQMGGLNQNLAGLPQAGAGFGGQGFNGPFGESSGPKPSQQGPSGTTPDLKDAPTGGVPSGANLWWKSDPFTGIYLADDKSSPVISNDGGQPSQGFASPVGAGGLGQDPGPQPPQLPPGVQPPFACPNFPNVPPSQAQQPEEGEEGDPGGGAGGGKPQGQPPGGGPPPGGGGGGTPQGAQIGQLGALAGLLLGEALKDLVIPFGQVSKAVGSLLPPDFQDWVNRMAAEMLAQVKPIIFPGYRAQGGPVQSFGGGQPLNGAANSLGNGSKLLR